MLRAGVHPQVVQNGWAITLDTDSHGVPAMQEGTAKRAAKFLQSGCGDLNPGSPVPQTGPGGPHRS